MSLLRRLSSVRSDVITSLHPRMHVCKARRFATASGEVRIKTSVSRRDFLIKTIAQEDGPLRLSCRQRRQDGALRRLFHAPRVRIHWSRQAQRSARVYAVFKSSKLLSVASHNHVRTNAGLFDVGHMVQSKSVTSEPPALQYSPLTVSKFPRRDSDGVLGVAHPLFPALTRALLLHALRPPE